MMADKGATPSFLALEVTYKCNFKCPFCYCVWHECPSLVKQELTTSQWKVIILNAYKTGVRFFQFTGGEALLRQDIYEIMFYASSLSTEIQTSVFTNGHLLSREKIRLMKKHGVFISTSLPGMRTYRKMTGTSKDFGHLQRLLQYGCAVGWPLDVSITVSSVNRFEVLDMFRMAANSGASRILVGPVMIQGKARLNPSLAIPYREWEKLKRELRSMSSGQIPCLFGDEILCSCREQPPEFAIYQNHRFGVCKAGTDFAVISPSGGYRKCLHSLEETTPPWERESVTL